MAGMAAHDPAPSRGPRRRRRALGWLALGGSLLLVAGLVAEVGRGLVPPIRSGSTVVEIPPHAGLLGIARILRDGRVIRSRAAFLALAVVRGSARTLKAGEYEIPRGASLLAVLDQIESGRVKPHLLVLIEGATVRDLGRQLEAEGLGAAEALVRAATDPALAQGLGVEAPGLEGYLFPDTYQVTKGMSPEEILSRMVHRLRERVATRETLARARERGLSLHQLLTLASIVEKEAALAEERPLIAAVFWNRLRRGMPLQADPTVAYAVGKDGRAPSRDDLLVDHPFNTYRYRGLPPGPIGNPGRAAVDAVLAPAPVAYLYFVSIDDRQHHFSTTLEEHNQAVARYRQFRRARAAL